MGMGWPQQLDVRLDGKLLKRFTVGGTAPGTPAAASYAGDGEPGFAGAPEWETYMQLTGDAGLEVRVPVSAGPARRRRVVRARAVGAGGPAATAAARPGADQRPDLHGLRGGRIGADRRAVPRRRPRRRPRRAAARSSSASRRRRRRDPAAATPAPRRSCRGWRGWRTAGRSPPADLRRRCSTFFESGRRDGGSFDAGIQFALERMLVDPDFLLRVQKDPPARAGAAAPAARRLSDIELASRLSFFLWSSIPDERLLESGRARRAVEAGDARPAGAAHAGRSARDVRARGRLRRAVAEPAARRRSRRASGRLSGLRRQPAATRSAGDASCSSPTRCARIAACRTCCAPTTRSSTSGWRVTTAFPASTAAASAASRCPNPDQRGGLLAHGALLATTSYPDRTSPVLRGKWLLDNIFGVYGAAAAGRRRHDAARRSGPARCRRPSASGWRSIATNPVVRQLPRGDRSAGLRARELRRDRRLADHRRSRAGRWTPTGTTVSGAHGRGPGRVCARCCCSGPISFRRR